MIKTIKGALSLRLVRVTSVKVTSMATGIQQVLGVISLESLTSLHLPQCCSIHTGLLAGLQSGAAGSITQHISLPILCLCPIPSSNCLDLKEKSYTAWRELRDPTAFPLAFIDGRIPSQIKEETSSMSFSTSL